jgi:hypothetical protein
MKSAGRAIAAAELLAETERREGCLILECGLKGPVRLWWAEERLDRIDCSGSTADRRFELDEELRRTVRSKYSAASGSATLVVASPEEIAQMRDEARQPASRWGWLEVGPTRDNMARWISKAMGTESANERQ